MSVARAADLLACQLFMESSMPMSKATNSSTSSKVSMLLTSCALLEGVVLFSIRIGYLHTSMPEQGQVSRVL